MMPGRSMLNSPVTNWRDSVSSDLRLHLVHKFLQALIPGVEKSAINDPRFQTVVSYARHNENICYENATSRSDYYHLLAQKIYKITTELERRRKEKRNVANFEDITNRLRNL